MIKRFPPQAWIADVRKRVLASEGLPRVKTVRRARRDLDRAAIEDVLVDVYQRLRTSVMTEVPVSDGVRSHPDASWPDEARLASTGKGLLVRSLGGDAVALDLECDQRTVLHVETRSLAPDLRFDVRAGERRAQDASIASIARAIDASLEAAAAGPRVTRAGDVCTFRRRQSLAVLVDDLPRELVGKGAPFAIDRVEEALVAAWEEGARWSLPRVRSRAESQLGGEDHGYVNGLGYGVVRHVGDDDRRFLWMTVDDATRVNVDVPAPGRDAPLRVTLRAASGRALAALSVRVERAFATRGIHLEPDLGPVQRIRERAWDSVYTDPVRTLALEWSSDFDRERMTKELLRLYAAIVPSQTRLDEVTDGREAIGSTGLEDVAYLDGNDSGLVVLSRAFGSYPGDATETSFFLLFPDGAALATEVMDQCSTTSVPYVLCGPPTTVDAIERALLAMR